jgi:ribosomal protein S18 acetylase RimI-like enzyme
MSYLIRQAAIDDLSAICNVENTCFPAAEAATKEAFRSRIAAFPERFLVAEDQSRIVGIINGCCTTEPFLGDELYEEDCPHSLSNPWQTVFGLAVLPEYQHRGIARALMAHLIALCQQGAQVGIILTCKQEKIGFYESMGFACRGISASSHGGAKWYDMVLTL